MLRAITQTSLDHQLRRRVRLGLRRRASVARAPRAREHVGSSPVLRALPRRDQAAAEPWSPLTFPPPRGMLLRAGVLATIRRAFLWFGIVLALVLGDVWDKLRGKSSLQRQAERLYGLFQWAGGTFTKLGQQLSVRIDLLPYEYCHELGKLLDSVSPMPVEQAIQVVERATGKPLRATFAAFDPKPIGSASIACVYQAELLTGEKVAVKVRRPAVADAFAADLRALSWLVDIGEFLAVFRPGYAQNLVLELRSTFSEELDFRMEAAYQAFFRRQARRGAFVRAGGVSAPRVFFELSSSEVLVQEFSSGIWLWELIAGVEGNDPVALARMRELGIDPKRVARRMQWAAMWAQAICPLYNADPHPANILVQRGNRLVFIDFGSCGTTNHAKRGIVRDLHQSQLQWDVRGVVDAMLALMQPLPPIDLNEFESRVERVMRRVFHQVRSRHAPWYERTAAARFYRFLEVARQYNLPVNMDTIRGFRAAMLYDTVALRIDPSLDIPRENERFERGLARHHVRRAVRKLRRGLAGGRPQGSQLGRFEDLADVATRGARQMERQLVAMRHGFTPMVEKPVVVLIETARLAAAGCVLYATWRLTDAGGAYLWACLGLLAAVRLRRVLGRLREMQA